MPPYSPSTTALRHLVMGAGNLAVGGTLWWLESRDEKKDAES